MITRSREHLNPDGTPPMAMLRSVLAEHLEALPRLNRLGDYYAMRNPILDRRRSEGLPNSRMAHGYARYITSVTTGYLLGQPVAYSARRAAPAEGSLAGAPPRPPAESATMAEIKDIFKRCSIASVDAENGRNAAIYGRGVEYVHTGEDGLPRISALSPKDAFVVYDDACDARPLFGVYGVRRRRADGAEDGCRVWVMTDRQVLEYRCGHFADAAYAPVRQTPHFFGGVPLVEYWNDEGETGDFEWVIPQIDGYDLLQSDRLNDKSQFVDALLVLVGCTLETDERGREPWRQLREDKALCLPDAQAGVSYLRSAMDESGNEILRASIVEDIHKLSMVPDLSDRSFSANASGVAMRYKLWGLEQLTRIKEQWFREGLKTRLGLLANYLALRGAEPLDVADVNITFTRSLPADLAETASTIDAARQAAAISTETAVRLFHAGDEWTDADVRDEVARIEGERGGDAP